MFPRGGAFGEVVDRTSAITQFGAAVDEADRQAVEVHALQSPMDVDLADFRCLTLAVFLEEQAAGCLPAARRSGTWHARGCRPSASHHFA
jgi:hypothetical protein